MTTPTTVQAKAEKALEYFFVVAKSFSGSAGEVKRVVKTGRFVQEARKRALVRILERLKRDIRGIELEIADETEEGEAAAPRARTYSAVRTKLESMVRQGELLPSSQFTHQLGLTRQALSKALASNRVFYVDFKSERYFPAFFTHPEYQRSQLEAVSKALGELPGGAKLQFFLTRRGSLAGETPLAALAKGKLKTVKALAEDFAEGR